MDQEEDFSIYNEQFLDEASSSSKRKVLQARILNLSLHESTHVYGRAGTELFVSGQLQKSIPFLKRAIITRSYETIAHTQLATVLFKLGKEDEAFAFIKKELSEGTSLHEFFIETLEQKQRLEDLESFSKEIVSMIKDPGLIPDYYYYIAEALTRCDKYPQAIVNFQKACENSPRMRHYQREAYGLALYHEGLFEEALIQFKHVRELIPHDKVTFNNIAHLTYCIGQAEEALEGFEYIIENQLNCTSTYANLILVLHHLDQDEEVITEYRDLLRSSLAFHGNELRRRYKEELRVTQVVLQRENIDEKTKQFNTKKLQGINMLLSFIN